MIEVKALTERRQFEDAVQLQRKIWGFHDIELLPVRLFVVANKVDLSPDDAALQTLREALPDKTVLAMSGATRQGIEPVLEAVWALLHPAAE